MSRLPDRLVTFLVIAGVLISFLIYHDDADYEVPYASYIFKTIAAFLFLIMLMRVVVRWHFVQKAKNPHLFKAYSPLGKEYLTKIKSLLITRIILLTVVGAIVYTVVPMAFYLALAMCVLAVEDTWFLVVAVFPEKLYVALGAGGIIKCTHQPSTIGFYGIKQVINETTSVQLIYKNGRALSLPFDYLKEPEKFKAALKATMKERDVYYKE